MNPKLKKELWDLCKGALGAAITAGVLAMMSYLGAHIPDVMQAIAMGVGGLGGVKAKIV